MSTLGDTTNGNSLDDLVQRHLDTEFVDSANSKQTAERENGGDIPEFFESVDVYIYTPPHSFPLLEDVSHDFRRLVPSFPTLFRLQATAGGDWLWLPSYMMPTTQVLTNLASSPQKILQDRQAYLQCTLPTPFYGQRAHICY